MKYSIQDRINFDLDHLKDSEWLIGIDEVGWGTIAGDLCIGSVIIHKDLLLNFPEHKVLSKIRDSKKLSEKIRQEVVKEVQKQDFQGKLFYFVSTSSVDYINEHGLALAYDDCLEQIFKFIATKIKVSQGLLLLDGSRMPGFLKTNEVKKDIVVKGDDLSLVIGLASILAKEHRDNLMNNLHLQYPQYNWANNKGYGTAEHIKSLKEWGISKFHRLKGTTTILS